MNEDLVSMIVAVDRYAQKTLSQSRYEHSVRVAEMARELCERFSVDPDLGFLAGIGHDICKAESDVTLLSLTVADGIPLSDIERAKPSLLHGRAAAVLLGRDFRLTDECALSAVRCHTFGAAGLCDLGKIIFVADKIEPGRTGIDPAFREGILQADLDTMTRMVLEDNIRYLEARGKLVSPASLMMLKDLNAKGERR